MMSNNAKDESSPLEGGAVASPNNFASAREDEDSCVPFHDIYSILSNYRETNNGGLTIPRTGDTMERLIPALKKIGFVQVSSSKTPVDEDESRCNDSAHDGDGSQIDIDNNVQIPAADMPLKTEVQETPAAAPASSSAAAQANTKKQKRCDICEQKDGFRGYNLQTCRVCGLAIHERCYGMALTTTKNLEFVCKACAAVGSKVEVNKPSVLGTTSLWKETIKVQERPTECVLCSVNDGVHAIHPLFDTHGPEGRQLVISTGGGSAERKLAWVHTLCANFICSKTGGSIYGCYGDDGRYQDESDEEYTDEENEVRFYAMATKEQGKETAWSKIIKDYRKTILCSLCGKRDNSGKSLRIPLQCCANDVDELSDFKRRHSDRSGCFVGMHVGCARWDKSPPEVYGKTCKMCYFFDGDDDGIHEDPQLACYCRHHAEDIIRNNPKYKEIYNSPRRPVNETAKKPSPPVAARRRRDKPEKWRLDHQASFKKGLTRIRKKDVVEKKRKFGAPDESPPKRQRYDDDAQKSGSTYNVQGRSSRILSAATPVGLKRTIEQKDEDQHQIKKFKS